MTSEIDYPYRTGVPESGQILTFTWGREQRQFLTSLPSVWQFVNETKVECPQPFPGHCAFASGSFLQTLSPGTMVALCILGCLESGQWRGPAYTGTIFPAKEHLKTKKKLESNSHTRK